MKFVLLSLLACVFTLSACTDTDPVSSKEPAVETEVAAKLISSGLTFSAPVAGLAESKGMADGEEDGMDGEEDGMDGEEDGMDGEEDGMDGEEDGMDGEEDGMDGEEDGMDGEEDGMDGEEDGMDGEEDGMDGEEDGMDGEEDGMDDGTAAPAPADTTAATDDSTS